MADLLSQRLVPDLWGHKAARLSQVADLGLPVPPGLCLSTAGLAHGTSEAIASLRTWLELYRPRRVVVRTSSTLEDGLERAHAGRSVSLLNCPPDSSALARVIDQDLLSREDLEAVPGGCVLVQEQVEASLYGVAFLSQDRLLVEASQYPDGATAGCRCACEFGVTPAGSGPLPASIRSRASPSPRSSTPCANSSALTSGSKSTWSGPGPARPSWCSKSA